MKRSGTFLLTASLVAGALGLPAAAQAQYNRNGGYYNGYNGTHPYDDNYDRSHYDRHHDDYGRHHGGIGPGKGALIGSGAGALIGGLAGGGKGALIGGLSALIGGGIGAGGGALSGKANADHRHNEERDYRDYGDYGYRR